MSLLQLEQLCVASKVDMRMRGQPPSAESGLPVFPGRGLRTASQDHFFTRNWAKSSPINAVALELEMKSWSESVLCVYAKQEFAVPGGEDYAVSQKMNFMQLIGSGRHCTVRGFRAYVPW